MAQEEGRFDFNDICAAISDKLERRHPHVFGELSADNSEEALVRWEQIKNGRARAKSAAFRAGRYSAQLPGLNARAKNPETVFKRGL
ncbi:Nucleoside triphosphate pyrophospho hydrolase MazG [Salmonella enterica subsp. enterica]|uniref:Nucleoside triphosphate pyrophospho hydrolase MazG n=1 Tax=Salmonella enterica I TaxID=59201 RepID=A0A447TWE3_SALET|nr:Nucleoside triphosphate pyrophospho hydrolase MazG [Salmonella enterica subsp. enterica]